MLSLYKNFKERKFSRSSLLKILSLVIIVNTLITFCSIIYLYQSTGIFIFLISSEVIPNNLELFLAGFSAILINSLYIPIIIELRKVESLNFKDLESITTYGLGILVFSFSITQLILLFQQSNIILTIDLSISLSFILMLALYPLAIFEFFIFIGISYYFFKFYHFIRKILRRPFKFEIKRDENFLYTIHNTWNFPNYIDPKDLFEWILKSYSTASIFSIPLGELLSHSNPKTPTITLFVTEIEISYSFNLTLFFTICLAIFYLDLSWKKKIPLFQKVSMNRKFPKFNIEKWMVLIALINSYVIFIKLLQLEKMIWFEILLLSSIILGFGMAIFIANYGIKSEDNFRSMIEKEVNNVNLTKLNPINLRIHKHEIR